MRGGSWRLGGIFVACGLLAACSGGQRGSTELTSGTRLRIAQAAEASGNADLAAEMYGRAGIGAEGDPATQIKIADGLIRSGQMPAADEQLQQALKAKPGQVDLLRALGLLHVMSGRPEQAIVELDQVLATKQQDLRALVAKGVALDLIHNHTDAQAVYRQALVLSPDDSDIRNNMAVSMMLEGRLAEAAAMLAPLENTGARADRMKNNLGIIQAASGNANEARRLLGDSVSPETLMALTRALAKAPASAPAAATVSAR